MTPNFYRKFAPLFVALTVTVLMYVTYANASSSTMSSSPSGDGIGAVSGYEVEDVSYHPAADASLVASVTFNLNAAASRVKIQLTDTQTDWYSCTNTGHYQWLCDSNNISISKVNQLRVVASGD